MKTCADCGRSGDVDLVFGRRRPDGPANAYCHACAAARTRKWYAANPDRPRSKPDVDKARARQRRYFVRNSVVILERQRQRAKAEPEKQRERVRRRRARLRAVTVVPVDYAALLEEHKCCYLCGAPLHGRVEFDHVIPITAGGPHVAWNILPTHPRCNRRKAGRDILTLTWVIPRAYCIALATRSRLERKDAA